MKTTKLTVWQSEDLEIAGFMRSASPQEKRAWRAIAKMRAGIVETAKRLNRTPEQVFRALKRIEAARIKSARLAA